MKITDELIKWQLSNPSGGECFADHALDQFFSRTGSQSSFRECYVAITGDQRVTGKAEDCDHARMRESLGTSDWPNVLGASVTRRMIEDYRKDGRYTIWRKLVSIADNVNDFRTQHRVRYGGYGDLPAVAEGASYEALPSPADEEASYAVSKRGGTEDITLEMIRNDDVQAIRRIPVKLAEAAQRTLCKFVLDFVRSNGAIYDGVALFDASHGNLGNGALSAVALAAARAGMNKQTELGTGDRLSVEPRFLWVPLEGEEIAHNLFGRGTNQDRTFVQNLKVEIVPVWYWTDADDWCLSGDPAEVPTIEIAFLEGEQDPIIQLQDAPTIGSMFANDKITFKIRHAYGGAVIDYRGIYKSAP